MLTSYDQVSLKNFIQAKATIFHNALFFLNHDIERSMKQKDYRYLAMYSNRAYIYDTLLQVINELDAIICNKLSYNELLNFEQCILLSLKDTPVFIHAESLLSEFKVIVRTSQEVHSNVTYIA